MFLVCGECLFDVFASPGEGAALNLAAVPGGSPMNVAIGLARMGHRAAFLSGVSRDFLGAQLQAHLAKSGVDTSYLQQHDAPTTLAFVQRQADGSAQYSFYGNGAADRQVSLAPLAALPAEIRAIHLGSYCAVVEPVAFALLNLVRRERGSRLIAYDPNVRLNVEPSRETWKARIDELAAEVHLLKLSDEDVRHLYGNEDPAKLAARWLDLGTKLVVMTRGENGLQAWMRGHSVSIPGVPAKPLVDTVGAGDTVQAAMLSHLADTGRLSAEGLASLSAAELETMLGFAARAASVTCSRRGADLPARADLN